VVLLIAVFYIGFIVYSDFSKFSSNIEHFKYEYLPAILFFQIIALLLMSVRQKILLKKIGIKIPFKQNVFLYLSGLSMIITPGGSGELIKSYYLKIKFGYKIAKTFPLVLVERFQDLITLLSVISFTLIFIQINEIMIFVTILTGLSVIVYTAFRKKSVFLSITKIFTKIPRLEKLVSSLLESQEGLYSMTSGKTMMKSWMIGICSWAMQSIGIYLVFIAFDVDLGFFLTITLVYSSILFGAISFLPGGIGVTEITATGLLVNEGLEISLATSIIIIVRVTTTWFATAIGFICTKLFLSK